MIYLLFSYSEKKKVKFEVIGKAKKIKNLKDRFNVLISGNDKASNFYKKMFGMMFSYVSNRVPEISNDIYKIDDAMKAGQALVGKWGLLKFGIL